MRELITKLFNRRAAYVTCFKDGDDVSTAGRRVLADLAKFCRAYDTTTQVSPVTRQVDPIASAQAEGRREVYLRIMWHLKLTDDQLMTLENENG